jgi:oligosaccharide repeat unit polymerase
MFNFLVNIDLLGLIFFIILFISLIFNILKGWREVIVQKLWSPLTLISIIFLFYTVIGPVFMISNNDTKYAGVEMSSYITLSWIGALLSYLSIVFAFKYTKQLVSVFNFAIVNRPTMTIGLLIFFIGFIGFFTLHGFDVSKLLLIFNHESKNNVEIDLNSGYLVQLVNFCVAGTSIIFFNYLKYRKSSYKLILFAAIFISIFLFILAGSRFRIIYLLISLATIYYLSTSIRPNIFLWISVFFLSVSVMGVISVTRSYQQGLDLSKIDDLNISQIFESGLNDTRVFYSSGALIHTTLYSRNYVPLEPIVTAISMPIPRSLWPSKPNAEYLRNANTNIWGTTDYGIAFMNYGDSFYMWGWLGIIFNGLFLGWLSKQFWLQYLYNYSNEYNVLLLALFNGFTYIMISRGYIAQEVTMFFMFILFPILIYKIYYKYFNK